jgi:hypothetical protein
VSTDPIDSPSDLGRRLANARGVTRGTCRACGQWFTGALNRRYCSDRCRWHFYRHRERQVALSLEQRLRVMFVGSAGVFLDEDGQYWLQLSCLRGPAKGEPGRPTSPHDVVLDASYIARFRALAAEEREQTRERTDAP